jgi:serine/threonine protein kinase
MSERDIFIAALERTDPVERSAYLDQACGENTALRRRVEMLLRVSDNAGDFLEMPAAEQVAADAGLSAVHTEGTEAFGQQRAATPHDHSGPEETQGQPVEEAGERAWLRFLEPSPREGALGRLGHYHILEVLGHGAFGIVLKAFDEKLHRVVAIKLLAPPLAASGPARSRFLREARAAAAVRHEHVVDIHAVEDQPLPYLVMEYVAGKTLQAKIDENGPLEVKEVLRIGLQIARGLAAAHQQGLIHRDVKPANVLLENGIENAKITDFGLARAADDASITQSGVVAGTPMYMAPEQAEGVALDHRADLFSLGTVLYVMCTGRPPFRASGTMAVLKRVCDDTPRPIREINSEIPRWLVEIVERLHAKKPAERYQSAKEVADLLAKSLSNLQLHGGVIPLVLGASAGVSSPEGPGAPNATRLPGDRGPRVAGTRRVLAAGTAVVLLAGLALALLFWTRGERGPQHPSPDIKPSVVSTSPPPFVILARNARAEGTFATLAEAVTAAQSGDTIEIRGNGPFVSDPINLGKKALVVRAGEGFRPVIELSPARGQGAIPSLDTRAPLVLEGLELRRIGEECYKGGPVPLMVRARGAPVRAANCRFVAFPDRVAVTADQSPLCELRNCELLSAGQFACVDHLLPRGGRLILANNVMLGGGHGVAFHYRQPDLADVAIELTRNTWVVQIPMGLFLDALPAPLAPGPAAPPKPIQLTASGNLLDGHRPVMEVFQSAEFLSRAGPLDASNTQALLGRLVTWSEQNNVYPEAVGLLGYYVAGTGIPKALPAGKSLADWNSFWDVKDTAAVRGDIRYRGGDLRSRSLTQLEQATAEDFRLADGSPGKGAGPGGKDLGADVELVGPGAAYERWKQTPQYQEWRKRTGQR